jgi:hypothetical protein
MKSRPGILAAIVFVVAVGCTIQALPRGKEEERDRGFSCRTFGANEPILPLNPGITAGATAVPRLRR